MDSFESMLGAPKLNTGAANNSVRPEQPRRLFYRPCEMAQTKREWLVSRMLGRGEMGMLFGGWGTYKSFIAMHLAVAIADGTEFLGRKVRAGSVAYMAGEGGSGMANRLRAATAVSRVADPGDPLQHRIWIASEIPPLTRDDGMSRVVGEIEAMPAQPDLLIIDTWFRACGSAGLDPNKPSDSAQLVEACDELRRRFPGLAVFAVHHTPNDRNDRASGWLGLPAAVDLNLSAEKVGHPTDLSCKVTVKKVKDGEDGHSFTLRLAKVVVGEDEDGQITSLRVASSERDTGEQDPGTDRAPKTRERLLAALSDAGGEGLGFDAAVKASSKANSTVSEALDRLVHDGKAVPFEGRDGKKRWRAP